MVTWAVALALGVGNPLLCLWHCQVWLPLLHQGRAAAQGSAGHAHHGHAMGAHPHDPVQPSIPQDGAMADGACAVHAGSGVPGSAGAALPQAFHEALPTAALSLTMTEAAQPLFQTRLLPTDRAPPPLLRPPIFPFSV